jgi:hypothetical protein
MGVSGLNQILSNFCLLVAKIEDGIWVFGLLRLPTFYLPYK